MRKAEPRDAKALKVLSEPEQLAGIVAEASGEVALVTGSAHGLGLAIAKNLAARGRTLVLHYNASSDAVVAAAAKELASAGAKTVEPLRADLANDESVKAFFDAIRKRFGRLDILVNSAGVIMRKSIAETGAEDWGKVLAVNVVAASECIRHAVPLGVKHVINIVDVAATLAWKNHAAYIASKAALAALTRVAAAELAPQVRVNGVSPGLVTLPTDIEARYAPIEDRIPMRRRGKPEEVAATVAMLLDSPEYITGQILAVDGGLSLR